MFIPWILVQAKKDENRRRNFGRFIIGGGGILILLATTYTALRGSSRLVTDHLEWLAFLPRSTLKHIDRVDNYGIPSLLAHLGFAWASSPHLALAATLLSWLACQSSKRQDLTFHLVAWISLAFSPMTWKQNFIVFIPLATMLASRLPRVSALVGLLAVLMIGFLTPYWTGESFIHSWGYALGPLWVAALALALSFIGKTPQMR
jgi:hypothetical protein